jgi:hypothetical protein
MKRWIAYPAARLCLLLAISPVLLPAQGAGANPAPAVPAQNPAPAAAATPQLPPVDGAFERFDFGIRLRAFPSKGLSVMGSKSSMTTTTTPIYDWNFRTTSHSPAWGGGVAFELHLSRKATFRAEALYNPLNYDKVADIYWGGDDSSTPNDERSHMVRVERTKARLIDVPLMIQYRALGTEGLRSRMFVSFGGAVRNVSTIRTTYETTFADTSKTTSQGRVLPSKRNLIGASVGIGWRFIDDFRIKSTPEIRYTRWGGSTFGSDSTQSPRNQLEFGMGFTF